MTNNSTHTQLLLSLSVSSDATDSDSEDPQVYESMCNIQAQAGSSDTAQTSDQGNNKPLNHSDNGAPSP